MLGEALNSKKVGHLAGAVSDDSSGHIVPKGSLDRFGQELTRKIIAKDYGCRMMLYRQKLCNSLDG
ncbi:hypothetical protein SAMN06265222_10628 [Neorhodopirellula lusitana]|uniref:Uncharacterized protein n=1 Tax=Neorhodopirellula lusitana TaxID=445327 RepID=A0ABY1Q6U5_9BACT|nr:hypothetical protein SAMN06265222_10628 [Neorhodopirellula lusitana]